MAFNYRSVPYRVRVRLARKRNEDEDSTNRLYTLVTYVPCTTFKGSVYSRIIFGGDCERLAHFSVKNLIKISLMEGKSHSKM